MEIIRDLDKFVIEKIEKLPRQTEGFLRAVTNLGSMFVIGPIAVIVAYLLWPSPSNLQDIHHANFQHSGIVVLALMPLASALKLVTRRSRPDTIYAKGLRFAHYSFPSGHAYGSLLMYGFLAYLALNWPISIIIGAVIFLIGLSRIYLGAHFPSDVLGGWLLAAVALVIVISIAS